MQITDRALVATGASSGIGLSTAEALTAKGGNADLTATDRRADTSNARSQPVRTLRRSLTLRHTQVSGTSRPVATYSTVVG